MWMHKLVEWCWGRGFGVLNDDAADFVEGQLDNIMVVKIICFSKHISGLHAAIWPRYFLLGVTVRHYCTEVKKSWILWALVNNLWDRVLAVSAKQIISHVHRAYDHLGPFGFSRLDLKIVWKSGSRLTPPYISLMTQFSYVYVCGTVLEGWFWDISMIYSSVSIDKNFKKNLTWEVKSSWILKVNNLKNLWNSSDFWVVWLQNNKDVIESYAIIYVKITDNFEKCVKINRNLLGFIYANLGGDFCILHITSVRVGPQGPNNGATIYADIPNLSL